MDPIGLVETLVAIVQVSGKLTTLCLDYTSQVKDAPEDINRLLAEVRSLSAILQRLIDVAETDASMVSLPSLQRVESKGGILAICLADLTDLAGLLKKAASNSSKRQALLWSLKQEDVAKTIQKISQAKSTIQLALAKDTG